MVKVYVEGGGNGKDLKSRCREGFSRFFEKAGLKGQMPRVIPCGGRKSAYDDFCTALEIAAADEFIILLVDSEDPTQAVTDPWTHLAGRQGDRWAKPSSAETDNAHLMVQCMETWFLADVETLRSFYGQGFNQRALPRNPRIEQILKTDVLNGLEKASKNTVKGGYSKGRHSFAILGLIDPVKVQEAAESAERLVKVLLKKAKVEGFV